VSQRNLSLVVMGVSGVGKTTLGSALAQALGWQYLEGDDFHSVANRRKMASGVALSDDDRWPWLDALVRELNAHGGQSVLSCSALKARYRDRLRSCDPALRFVWLRGSESLIGERLSGRQGHYMPSSLLRSQLEALEPPLPAEQALEIDVEQPACELIAGIVDALRLDTRGAC
jgi:gluconokinase